VENNHLHVVADHGANRLPAMLTALLNSGASPSQSYAIIARKSVRRGVRPALG
jgi:hypothetical protein